jgi:hypothetical protein
VDTFVAVLILAVAVLAALSLAWLAFAGWADSHRRYKQLVREITESEARDGVRPLSHAVTLVPNRGGGDDGH